MEIPSRTKNNTEVAIGYTWTNPNQPEQIHMVRIYRDAIGEIIHLGPLCKKYKGPQDATVTQETPLNEANCDKCLYRNNLMFPELIIHSKPSLYVSEVKFGEIAIGYTWQKNPESDSFHAVMIVRGPTGEIELVTPLCTKRLTGFVNEESEERQINCTKCLRKMEKGRGVKAVETKKALK